MPRHSREGPAHTSGLVAVVLGMSGPVAAEWQENGNPVCEAPDEQDHAVICASQILYARDRTPGQRAYVSIVAWADDRDWGAWESDICAQMVSAEGNVLWDPAGVAICDAPGQQSYPATVPDGAGGAIVVWRDWRGVAPFYAQRVDGGGVPLRMLDGAPVCISSVSGLPEIAPDGESGAVVVWNDGRNLSDNDVFAKRLPADYGQGMGIPETSSQRLRTEQNSPNPFNPATTIRCHVTEPGRVRLDMLDVSGRVVARLIDRVCSAGPLEVEWRGLDESGRPLASGVYFCRLRSGLETATMKMVLIQ